MFGSAETNMTAALDWTEVYEAVRCVQLVMALLSVLGSASTIVCVMSQKLGRTPELQPLLLLSLSDLLLALGWLTGAALFSQPRAPTHTLCYNLHTLEQVLYMSSFFYTLNYMWNLYRGVRDKLHLDIYSVEVSSSVRTADRSWALLSGLFPLLLMTPVFIEGNISRCQTNFTRPYRCLLMDTGALYLTSELQQPIRGCRSLHTYAIAIFLLTFVFTLLSITVFMVRARHMYRRVVTSGGYLGNDQWTSFRVMDRRTLLYPLVFVLCWGPAVALASLRLTRPAACQGTAAAVLYVSQTFTSASQGFLNCLVYGWTHSSLRRAGRSMLSQDVDSQTPLLPPQKKTNYWALSNMS